MVSRDRSASAAFSRPAFSRSSRPMRPRSDEQVMTASGITAATSSAARLLVAGIERREDRRDADRLQARRLHLLGGLGHRRLVERHEGPAVIFVAAFDHPDAATHQRREILRPVAERRQRGRGRHAEPERRDLGEVTALDHGIDEMRGADHHAVDFFACRPHPSARRSTPRLFSDSRMPVVTSSLVGALTAPHHLAVFDQDGVGIGAAHVDANASHAENTLLKSRS